MRWPSSRDYNEAVQDPSFSFKDAELRSAQATTNAHGLPVARSGGFADVYQLRSPAGGNWAVKCFTKEVSQLRHRYQAISEHLAAVRGSGGLGFMVDFQYLDDEIRVGTTRYPALKMAWVEGKLLHDFVREHIDDGGLLEKLAGLWHKLGQNLRTAGMAHGDLQHGNVILVPTAKGVVLRLIDYDGMYVPTLEGTPASEVGHPSYQHPGRDADRFHFEMDRFPLLLVYTSIRCLAVGGRKLWQRYNNGDNLLFRESDLKNPAGSALCRELWSLSDPAVRALVGWVILASRMPLREVPLLDAIIGASGTGVPTLTSQQEAEVQGLLYPPRPVPIPQAEPIASPSAPPPHVEPSPPPRPREEAERAAKPVPVAKIAGIAGGLLAALVLMAVMISRSGSKPEEEITTVANSRPLSTPKVEKTAKVIKKNPETTPPVKMPDPKPVEPPKVPSPIDPIPGPIPVPPVSGNVIPVAFNLTLKAGETRPVDVVLVRDGYAGPLTLELTGLPLNVSAKRVSVPAATNTARIELASTANAAPGAVTVQIQASANGTAFKETGDMVLVVREFEPATAFKPRMLQGHSDTIRGVALSADGKIAISGSRDKIVRVWDVDSGKETAQFNKHTQGVFAVGLSADGKVAISGGSDSTVRVWETSKGTELYSLTGHTDLVFGVGISADGKRGISGGSDRSVRVWNLETGKELHRFTGHTRAVLSVAISADGKRAVSGSADGSVRVWDVEAGKELSRLEHTGEVNCVAITADGRRAVSGGTDMYARVWDVEKGLESQRLAHVDAINAVALTRDGTHVATGVMNWIPKIWDLSTGKAVVEFKDHKGGVYGIGISADGKRVACGGTEKTVWVTDTTTVEPAFGTPDNAIANSFRGAFRSRDPAVRNRFLKAYGGNAETERAVALGLAWLARQQKLDGGWEFDGSNKDERIAATGMALLPFLAAGETDRKGKYMRVVDKGLQFLLRNCPLAGANAGRMTGNVYAQAIGTLALCEAYGMTRDKALLLIPTQTAINYIVGAQAANGSWGYSPRKDGDTSITGWQIQALKAAQRSKDLVVPVATFQKASTFLDSMAGAGKATYGYNTNAGAAPGTALTAIGLLCRTSIDGWGPAHPGLAEGISGLMRRAPAGTTASPATTPRRTEAYFDYYATQVVHFFGGNEWKDWNEGPRIADTRKGGMRDWLVGSQIKTPGATQGSFDPDGGFIGQQCGRLGTTAMCILNLQIYYRYAPGLDALPDQPD